MTSVFGLHIVLGFVAYVQNSASDLIFEFYLVLVF
jgi:hypothetical protein